MTFKQELLLEVVRMHKFLLQDPLVRGDDDAATENVKVIEATFKQLVDVADRHCIGE